LLNKKIRLKDIAKASNVSISTASRALNESDHISPATRKKVQAEAMRQNYTPGKSVKPGDRSKPSRYMSSSIQSPCLVIVECGLTHSFFAESLIEIASTSTALGYEAKFIQLDSNASTAECLEKALILHPCAIIFITWGDLAEADAIVIDKCGVPVVLINRHIAGYGNSVTLDDFSAGVRIARYFYNMGHRRIAHLMGQDSTAVRERAQGMRCELERLSCYDPQLFELVHDDYCFDSVNHCVRKFLAASPPVTAIWAYRDAVATIALTAISAAGLKVPGDISIAGFNNTEQMRSLKLTSFDNRLADLGREAVCIVNDLIRKQNQGPKRVCLIPTFIEGTTVGPVPTTPINRPSR